MSLHDVHARHLVILAGLACAALVAPAARAQQYDLSTSNVTVDLSVLNDGGRGAAVTPVDRMPLGAMSPPASGLRLKIPGESAPASALHVPPPASVARSEPPSQTAAAPAQAPAAAPAQRAERRPSATPAQPPAPPRQTAAAPAAPPAPPRQAVRRETPAATPDARGPIMPAQTIEPPQTASAQPPQPPSVTPPAPPARSQQTGGGMAGSPPPAVATIQSPTPPAPPAAQPPPPPAAPQASLQAARTTGDAAKPGEQLRIAFAEEDTKVPAAQLDSLKALAGRLKDTEDLRLQLMAYAGNADMPASKARRLSLSRALAVRSYLIENGIRSTRIDVRALGNKADDEPRNRVDVVIAER